MYVLYIMLHNNLCNTYIIIILINGALILSVSIWVTNEWKMTEKHSIRVKMLLSQHLWTWVFITDMLIRAPKRRRLE